MIMKGRIMREKDNIYQSGLLSQESLNKLPRTAVLNCRCDIKSLATILSFIIAKGHRPQSKSAIIRTGIDMFAIILRLNGKGMSFEKTGEALVYLEKQGLSFLKEGEKNNLIMEIQKENISTDFDNIPIQHEGQDISDDVQRAMSEWMNDMADE